MAKIYDPLSHLPEWQKAQRGELYRAFGPELIEVRDQCQKACLEFNTTTDTSRRNTTRLWRKITNNPTPLPEPPQPFTQESDDALFRTSPFITAPLRADYGFNVSIGPGTFLNHNAAFVDTCPIIIGSRCLFGPYCQFYSGTHPLDPALRDGFEGPETGKPITIHDDVWCGGNVIVLPGVTIGRGAVVGAGSVVTRDVEAFTVVAGNPARVLRRIESKWDERSKVEGVPGSEGGEEGAEVVMAEMEPK